MSGTQGQYEMRPSPCQKIMAVQNCLEATEAIKSTICFNKTPDYKLAQHEQVRSHGGV